MGDSKEQKRFDGVCPWCGREAADADVGVVYERRCECGAVAFGAPACDFDEVIDEAIDRFGIAPDKMDVNFAPPGDWLAGFGIEIAPGGEGRQGSPLGPVVFYWFRRTAPEASEIDGCG